MGSATRALEAGHGDLARASISVQKVGRGQLRSLRCDGYAGDAPQVDKFSSLPLGVFGVTVDRERSLTASPIARVETDDHPDLPDSRRSLPDRSRAALRSPLNRRRIPISRAHPYIYRDSYRDERTFRRRSEAPASHLPGLLLARSKELEPPTF
jgi:hypothetical protein